MLTLSSTVQAETVIVKPARLMSFSAVTRPEKAMTTPVMAGGVGAGQSGRKAR